MHIDHIALWTNDLERLKQFYVDYFAARPGELYANPSRGFSSYFLSFASGAQLELMSQGVLAREADPSPALKVGYAHFAMAVGSPSAVDDLTAKLRQAGCPVISAPRRTGDGYYESLILDPDGNRIELSAGPGEAHETAGNG